MGTGDYRLGEQYRSKNRARDVEKAQKLLKRLGTVPTYAQLVERLRKGADVRPLLSEYRSPTAAEETEEEDNDVGEVEDQMVQVDQIGEDDSVSKGLETDLEELVRDMSVSPETTVIEGEIPPPPSGLPSQTAALRTAPPVQSAQPPSTVHPLPIQFPATGSEAAPLPELVTGGLLSIAPPPSGRGSQTAPPPRTTPSLQTAPPPRTTPSLQTAPPPSTAAPLLEPDGQQTFMSPGLADSMFRCQGTEQFIIEGRSRAYICEPRRGSCGQVRINMLGSSIAIFNFQCSVQTNKQEYWCPHLVSAAQKLGMKVVQRRPYIRNLTQLRRNQRPDKKAGKSGKKSGRPGNHFI